MTTFKTIHMLRFITTMAIFFFTISPCAGEEGLEKAYTRISKLNGKKYRIQRDSFLKREGVKSFLNKRLLQEPFDWLAFALHQHFSNPKLRNVCTSVLKTVTDNFKKSKDMNALDWSALNDLYYRYSVIEYPTGDIIDFFDQDAKFALNLEVMVRNPNEISPGCRFWLLKGEMKIPLNDEEEKHLFMYVTQSINLRKKMKYTHKKIKAWLTYIINHETDPFAKLWAAARLPGKASKAVLIKLSKSDSALGAWAALLFAGRARSQSPYYHFIIGHPFNPTWLSDWSKNMTPKQRAMIETYFSKVYEKPANKAMPTPVPSEHFPIPKITMGIFLKQGIFLKSKKYSDSYNALIQSNVDSFIYDVRRFTKKGIFGEDELRRLKWGIRTSALWPQKTVTTLNGISTTNPNVRKLIDHAIKNIKNGHQFPSPDDLNLIFSPAPN